MPAASASTATVGSASSSDGSDEDVGDRGVARDVVVGHEAGERDAVADAGVARLRLERLAQRAGAADDQPHVVAAARDARERVDQVLLAGQLVQALHVEHDARLADAERGAPRRARRRRRRGVNAGATAGYTTDRPWRDRARAPCARSSSRRL